MTDVLTPPSVKPSATVSTFGSSAGAMLREARERQGIHIAMLAATMKVAPLKLEALEADRYDELPDLAFARALAKTVCRTLKIDAEPVMARLPSIAKPERLEHAATGLATPFREGAAGHHPTPGRQMLKRPVLWATSLVLLAAAALAFAPPAWLQKFTSGRGIGAGSGATVSMPAGPKPAAVVTEVVGRSTAATAPSAGTAAATASGTTASSAAGTTPATTPATPTTAASAASSSVGPTKRDESTVIETVHAAPASTGSGAAGALVIRAKGEAWVDVSDAKGRSLLARSLQAGETVGIDGEAPFRLRLGNTPQTEIRFRGEAVDLASRSSGTTARFELK